MAVEGGELDAASQFLMVLEPGQNPPGGIGRFLGDGLKYGALELPDHAQIDQCPRDIVFEAELPTDLG